MSDPDEFISDPQVLLSGFRQNPVSFGINLWRYHANIIISLLLHG